MANFNFNKVILGGRLTADPELKTTPSGKSVTTFNIAINRGGKDEQKADFFTVSAWNGTAEFITRFFRKGQSICVEGQLQTRSWDSGGQRHYATEIVAGAAYFVDSKSETINVTAPQFEEINGDAELSYCHGKLDEFTTGDTREELPF